jgi:cell division protein FtsL
VKGAHGLGAVVVSIALLAAMFAAVHRGARGREQARKVHSLDEQRLALEARKAELVRRIEALSNRARVIRAAGSLGLRLPGEGELVILELPAVQSGAGGAGGAGGGGGSQ